MQTTSFFALALLSAAVWAQDCPSTYEGQCYIAKVGFYSDKDCSTQTTTYCSYGGDPNNNCGPANYGFCPPSFSLPPAPFYAKIIDTPNPDVQVAFLESGSSCPMAPPGGTNAVVSGSNCVEVTIGGDGHGIEVGPQGLGIPAKRDLDISAPQWVDKRALRAALQRRDLQCTGWKFVSQVETTTAQQQVSTIVDCTSDPSNACPISKDEQHTTSVTTTWSLTAGGDVEGLSASATFGQSYTDSVTSGIQTTYNVPAGQKGYLNVYSSATQFTGTYTGCNTPTSEADGVVVAIHGNGLTYGVTITS